MCTTPRQRELRILGSPSLPLAAPRRPVRPPPGEAALPRRAGLRSRAIAIAAVAEFRAAASNLRRDALSDWGPGDRETGEAERRPKSRQADIAPEAG